MQARTVGVQGGEKGNHVSSQEEQGSLLPLTAAILTSFVAFNTHTYIFRPRLQILYCYLGWR